jgi:splicing factor 3B subunit 1
MLDGFQIGTVVNALGKFYNLVQQRLLITLSSDIRVKPYLLQTVTTILWRLNNRSAKVRQQAADLTTC